MRRTQTAILSAFSRLVLSREFDSIRVDEIIREADVARSTFYQHFRSKDDVLCASMGPVIFEPLAQAGLSEEPSQQLLWMADHVWGNRHLGRSVFRGSTKAAIVRNLAGKIEQVLGERLEGGALPVPYVASTIANWQVASLSEWLAGRHRVGTASWARALCQGTRSLTAALAARP